MKRAHLDAIESLPLTWLGLRWKPVRHALGINAYHGENAGDLVVEEHAAEPDTVVVAIGAEAKGFEPSAWEFAFRGQALFDLGRHDEARVTVEQGLGRYPDRADIVYGRACLEDVAGSRDAALADLRRAIELHPDCADWARDERAFDALRDDPRFPS